MPKPNLDEAIARLVRSPGAFCPEAYDLVNSAMNSMLNRLGVTSGEERHLQGKQLCLGFRDYVLHEFGPMSTTILEAWGIRSSRQIGEIVFQFISVGYYRQAPQDRIEDFDAVFDFKEAFERPFQPKGSLSDKTP